MCVCVGGGGGGKVRGLQNGRGWGASQVLALQKGGAMQV